MENNEIKSFNTFTISNITDISSLNTLILESRLKGINTLRLIYESPTSDIEFPKRDNILIEEFEEYLKMIKTAKSENPDMNILIGLVSEYDKSNQSFLGELRSNVDFIALNANAKFSDENYPLEIAKNIISAIESGIFDIIISPDDFLKYRNTLLTEEKRIEFDNNSKIAINKICDICLKYNIPLKFDNINLASIEFLKIVSLKGNKVIISGYDKLNNEIKNLNLNYVDKEYNFVMSRLLNQMLNYIFKNKQANSNTIYYSYSEKLLKETFKNIPKSEDRETVKYYIMSYLDNFISLNNEEGNKKIQELFSEIEELNKSNLEIQIKAKKLSNIKSRIKETNETLQKRNNLILLIKEYVKYTFLLGINNENDVIEIVTKLVEIKMTKNESKRNILIDSLNEITNSGGKENVAKLAKKNPIFQDNSNNREFIWSNNGFINITSISLLLAFFLGFGISIAFMILKMNF